MKKSAGSTQFYCFSPPVMIATFAIEITLAAYTVFRYKMNELTRLIATTVGMLAMFQVAEYFVCTGTVGHATVWSRIGFAAITTLPPLGLHIMHVVANKPNRKLVATAYTTMAAFIITFLVSANVFDSYQCTGNYVIFHLRPHLGGYYWVYYSSWIGLGIVLGLRWANKLVAKNKPTSRQVQAIRALIASWLVFIIPTAVANIVKPETKQGIPSIMCGFAVLFALILVLYIAPRRLSVKEASIQPKKLA